MDGPASSSRHGGADGHDPERGEEDTGAREESPCPSDVAFEAVAIAVAQPSLKLVLPHSGRAEDTFEDPIIPRRQDQSYAAEDEKETRNARHGSLPEVERKTTGPDLRSAGTRE